ncbi:MAG: hypothetical protein GX307_03210 [Euryarchaeota archaeon]|nr:hypothetical protein [Euryarchaeota archaeon]
MIDLQDIVEQRLSGTADEGLVNTSEVMDDWGVITFYDGSGNVIRCEFIETERSWKRRDAVQDYNDLISEGVEVLVIVPESVLESVDNFLGIYAHPDVQLSSMDELGIMIHEIIPP